MKLILLEPGKKTPDRTKEARTSGGLGLVPPLQSVWLKYLKREVRPPNLDVFLQF